MNIVGALALTYILSFGLGLLARLIAGTMQAGRDRM